MLIGLSIWKILRWCSSHHFNEGVILLYIQSIQFHFDLGYVCSWLDIWFSNSAHFGFLIVHVIDVGYLASSTICDKVSHYATVEARAFHSTRWCRSLSNLDFFSVLLIVFCYVCLETLVRESGVGYVHQD